MRVPFFESPWKADQAVVPRIAEVLASGCYVGGAETQHFESEFSKWLGGRHVVGVNSGTDALYLALVVLGIGEHDEVILPSYSFIACLEAVVRAGASPVLVDCRAGSFLPGIEQIGAATTAATRAVLAVPLFGETAGLPELQVHCRQEGLLLIEDVAQACGGYAAAASQTEMLAGTFGEASAFSFYPTKTLAGAGDSGAATFADPQCAERCRALGNHGLHGDSHREFGINSRLDALQAALLRIGLRNLPASLQRRRDIVARYLGAMSELPLLRLPAGSRGNAWNHFVVRHPRRDELQRRLADLRVGTRVYYVHPIHRQPAYQKRFPSVHLPNCEKLAKEALALPLYPAMAEEQIDHVIRSTTQACEALAL